MHRRTYEAVAVLVPGLLTAYAVVVGSPPAVGLLLLLVTTGIAARGGARWWVVLPVDAIAFAVVDPHAERVGDVTFSGGLLVLAYGVGRAVWWRRHRVGTLEREAREATAREEERVAAAVVAARASMAVELHDIVTHAVSAVIVLAQAGRRGRADVVDDVLVAIEETARTAMAELRRLLSVLEVVRVPRTRDADRTWLRDALLAVGVAGLGELELWSGERYNGVLVWPGPRLVSAVLIAALGAALLLRRTHPDLMAVLVFGLLAAEGVLVGSTEAAVGPILVVVAAFSAAAHGARSRVLVPMVVVQCAIFAVSDNAARGLFDRVWMFGLAALALALGRGARRRQRRIGALERQALAQERAREQRVNLAVAIERSDLARELHDIVSHAVSVIVIQAQAGRCAPAAAPTALSAIEEAARTAMAELRRLLVLLDPEGTSGGVRPTASLEQIEDLLVGWRSAGMLVEFQAEELPPLAPAVDLTAYRIVQECLTNTAKHAPGARVEIEINVVGDQLEVCTRDVGAVSVQPTASGAGRGLIGMRERIELVGGELVEIGRGEQGFVVHARLPLQAVPA